MKNVIIPPMKRGLDHPLMERIKVLALSALLVLIAAGNPYAAQRGAPIRVLFLGNSVFYFHGGLYQSFEGFCAAGGVDAQAVSQREAPEYTHGIEFLNYGRIPLTLPEMAAEEAVHALILNGRFDYVILEARREGYLLPEWVDRPDSIRTGEHIPYQQNLEALGKLHRTIVNTGAQTVLYMHPGLRDAPFWRHPVAQIYEKIRHELEHMEIGGERHEVLLVPASLLWGDAIERFGLDAWYADYIHGKGIARYASGCMLYAYITGRDPRANSYRQLPSPWTASPDEEAGFVAVEDARWIKNQVWLYYSTRPE